jgi:hypothetical protein
MAEANSWWVLLQIRSKEKATLDCVERELRAFQQAREHERRREQETREREEAALRREEEAREKVRRGRRRS